MGLCFHLRREMKRTEVTFRRKGEVTMLQCFPIKLETNVTPRVFCGKITELIKSDALQCQDEDLDQI